MGKEVFRPQDEIEKEMAEQLAKDSERDLVIAAMRDSFDIQDDPMVGPFWYDPLKNELYGVRPVLASETYFYKSPQFSTEVKTGKQLHKNIWAKEYHRGKDQRFFGDYTRNPRGRVFEFKDQGFVVFTGDWIDEYPQAKELVLEEFQLPPEKTEFRKDNHWDLGHGWSHEV